MSGWRLLNRHPARLPLIPVPSLDEQWISKHRHEHHRLLPNLIEAALFSNEHRAADGIDDVVVALGVDQVAVRKCVGVSREMILDFQIVRGQVLWDAIGGWREIFLLFSDVFAQLLAEELFEEEADLLECLLVIVALDYRGGGGTVEYLTNSSLPFWMPQAADIFTLFVAEPSVRGQCSRAEQRDGPPCEPSLLVRYVYFRINAIRS